MATIDVQHEETADYVEEPDREQGRGYRVGEW